MIESDEDLSNEDLADLEKQYGDKKPTYPCRKCGAADWSLQSVGRGRETWVCRNSLNLMSGGPLEAIDWEHYEHSRREFISGDSRISALIAEVRRRRQ